VAFDDGFIGDGFVGVTGDDDIIDVGNRDPGPSVMDLTVDKEFESEIAVGDPGPGSGEARVGVLKKFGPEYALFEIRRSRGKETGRPVGNAKKSYVGTVVEAADEAADEVADEVAGGRLGKEPYGVAKGGSKLWTVKSTMPSLLRSIDTEGSTLELVEV
jgi:hypothetical protein